MKAIRIKMTDSAGLCCYWTVRRFEWAWNCGGNLPHNRHINGWSFTDHEGIERCVEGNWLALVDHFRLVASNYGLTTQIS